MNRPARLGISLVTIGLGWILASLLYLIWLLGAYGTLADIQSWLFYTGVFAFIGWATVAAPLAAFGQHQLPIFRLPWAVLFGAVVGAAILLALLSALAWQVALIADPLPLYPEAAIIGAIGWGLYACLLEHLIQPTTIRSPGSVLPK